MLTNLTQSDAGNYSCRGMRKSGPQSQWVYIHGELRRVIYLAVCPNRFKFQPINLFRIFRVWSNEFKFEYLYYK